MGDIVERLRSWSPSECWHCGEWGCFNAAGHSIFCEGGCRCEEFHYDKKCSTPCAECGGDDVCVCGCHTDYSTEAADEIERLRGIVNDLRSTLGPHPLTVNIECENPSELAARVIDSWNQMRRDGGL